MSVHCALGRSTLDVWKQGPRKVNMGRPTILRDGSGGQAEIIIRVHIHPGSHLLPTSLYPQGFLCLPSASFSANLSIVPHNFLFTGQRLTCRRESRLEFIIVFSSEHIKSWLLRLLLSLFMRRLPTRRSEEPAVDERQPSRLIPALVQSQWKR